MCSYLSNLLLIHRCYLMFANSPQTPAAAAPWSASQSWSRSARATWRAQRTRGTLVVTACSLRWSDQVALPERRGVASGEGRYARLAASAERQERNLFMASGKEKTTTVAANIAAHVPWVALFNVAATLLVGSPARLCLCTSAAAPTTRLGNARRTSRGRATSSFSEGGCRRLSSATLWL